MNRFMHLADQHPMELSIGQWVETVRMYLRSGITEWQIADLTGLSPWAVQRIADLLAEPQGGGQGALERGGQ